MTIPEAIAQIKGRGDLLEYSAIRKVLAAAKECDEWKERAKFLESLIVKVDRIITEARTD